MTLSLETLGVKILILSLPLLSLLAVMIGATPIETIEPSQINLGEEQSVTLVEGVVLKIGSPYIFHHVEGVSSFGKGIWLQTAGTIEVKLEDISSKVGNVTVEAELTEIRRRSFKLYAFEPMELELWRKGKPAKALMEKDCDWRCRVTIDAGNRRKLYLAAVDKVDPSYPIVIVMKYNLSYYELMKDQKYNEYGVVIPLFSRSEKGEVEVKGRFESNVPIEFYAYLSRKMEEEQELLYKTEGSGSPFQFKVRLSKDYVTLIRFKVVNTSTKEAYVKIWAEASWLKSPDFKPVSWYIEGAGKVHEVKMTLSPRYVKENSTYQWLIEMPKSYYWHSLWPICPKGYNYTIEIHAEEPSGIPLKLLLLDEYNYEIFRKYDPKVGQTGLEYYEDPSGILPLVKPFYEVGSTSNVTIKLSGLKKCYIPIFVREGGGLLTVKYIRLDEWIEEARTLSVPRGWISGKSITLLPIMYAALYVVPPTIVEGSFKADNPVNIFIEANPVDIFIEALYKGAFLYEVWNATAGEFSFYIYGINDIRIVAENLGWKPTEVRVWVKYSPIKAYIIEETTEEIERTTWTTPKLRTETRVSPLITEGTTKKVEEPHDLWMYVSLILMILIISVVALTIIKRMRRQKAS